MFVFYIDGYLSFYFTHKMPAPTLALDKYMFPPF